MYICIYLYVNVYSEWYTSNCSPPPDWCLASLTRSGEERERPTPTPWNLLPHDVIWYGISLILLPSISLHWEWPWLCTTLLGGSFKFRCVINNVFLLKQKHCTIPNTQENNSIPAETKTISIPYSIPFTLCSDPTISTHPNYHQEVLLKGKLWVQPLRFLFGGL